MRGRAPHSGDDEGEPTRATESWSATSGDGAGDSLGAESTTTVAGKPVAAGPTEAQAEVLRRGDTVGRFVILEGLGVGGMGQVHAAYDPQLDRRVALKLLRFDREQNPDALLREAKALARLDHPNVVTVHEVGAHGDRLFLVMEYVPGLDLGRWLKQERPSRRQILDVFVQAGDGLAAAHRAAIVHRDFKAGNVMLRPDGRAQVVDFGIARTDADALVIDPAELAAGRAHSTFRALAPTAGIAGTPGMMSPEQRRGEPVGPASDQYSFCVALGRALERAAEESSGRTPGRGLAEPWLERVLERGRAESPEERFPSMEVLLSALRHDPRERRKRQRRWALVALALPILAITIGWFVRIDGRTVCKGGEHRLAAVWNEPRSDALATALASSDRPWAATIAATVRRGFDSYGERWVAAYTEACEATQIHGEQSTELLDRRMDCLEQRLGELDALATVLTESQEEARAEAVEAVDALVPVTVCADSRSLMELESPPLDGESRARSEDLRHRLARARALRTSGETEESRALTAEVADEANDAGLWSVAAEALLRLGLLEELAGEGRGAAELFGRAQAAARAAGHDRVAAEALVRSVRVAGYLEAELGRARHFAGMARAVLDRSSHMADLEAILEDQLGVLELQAGNYERAALHHRKALELAERLFGPDHGSIATTLLRLTNVLLEQGSREEARSALERALRIRERAYGSVHPEVGAVLDRLGALAFQLGDYPAALEWHRRALGIAEVAEGEGHLSVGNGHMHVGAVLTAMGRHEPALDASTHALRIYQQRLGEDHPHVALALSNIGTAYHQLGDGPRALDAYSRALAIQEAAYGNDHPWVARTVYNLGETSNEFGEPREAWRHYRRALDIWLQVHGEAHLLVAYGRSGLGRALIGLGEPAEAANLLEAAIRHFEAEPGDPVPLAEARFSLARALRASGVEEGRVAELTTAARAALVEQGANGQRLLQRIRAWEESTSPESRH